MPTFRPQTERTDVELAWAAGFFDGEGWTTSQGRYVQIGVAQADRRPLDRFKAAVGAGSVTKTRPVGAWRTSHRDAVRVMEKLWPYLSETKREQFLRVWEGLAS